MKQKKFTLREEVAEELKSSTLSRIRNLSGVMVMARGDYDGGEVIEFRIGKGKTLVVIEWNHWMPWERPILTISSNSSKAMASVLSAIVFDDDFFNDI